MLMETNINGQVGHQGPKSRSLTDVLHRNMVRRFNFNLTPERMTTASQRSQFDSPMAACVRP